MQLYRIDLDAGPPKADLVATQELKWLMDHKFLIEVEPCEHGNYARHMVDRWFRNDTGYNEKWCLGAELGGVS